MDSLPVPGDGDHLQVDIRAEPPVQLHLPAAEEVALGERGVVQIPQVDRLFHLVNILAGKENKRHLGLHQPYLRRLVGIGLRLEQPLDYG